MTMGRGRAAAAVLGTVLLTTACSDTGALEISNESEQQVTVRFGAEDVEVSAGGGAILHDVRCSAGDVAVASAAGQTTTLRGPVCPGELIVVDRAGRVTVSDAAGDA